MLWWLHPIRVLATASQPFFLSLRIQTTFCFPIQMHTTIEISLTIFYIIKIIFFTLIFIICFSFFFLSSNHFLLLFHWSHSSLIWIVFFDFILLINFHGVAFKTRLNSHKPIVNIKKKSKWQLILIAFIIIMMYYWPAPTIYE
jgi:hypothetical protein